MENYLSVSQAAEILKILSDAHKAGVYIFDFKPDNIGIRADGSLVLFDLGGSEVYRINEGQVEEVIIGLPAFDGDRIREVNRPRTQEYATVELDSNERDLTADVFAVGTMLYRMLGNEPVLAIIRAGNPYAMNLGVDQFDVLGDVGADVFFLQSTNAFRPQRYTNATDALNDLLPGWENADLTGTIDRTYPN